MIFRQIAIILLALSLSGCITVGSTAADAAIAVAKVPIKIVGAVIGAAVGTAAGMENEDMAAANATYEDVFNPGN